MGKVMDISIIKATANRFSADRFYDELFKIDPTLRPMFPADLSSQKHKLTNVILHVVNNIDNLDSLKPTLHALGKRHTDLGVTAQMYDSVGAALVLSLDLQTDDEVETWVEAYAFISNEMKYAK
jgi:hemoglobin-like flavoprotein